MTLVFLVFKDTDFWHKWALKYLSLHLVLRGGDVAFFYPWWSSCLAVVQSPCVSNVVYACGRYTI